MLCRAGMGTASGTHPLHLPTMVQPITSRSQIACLGIGKPKLMSKAMTHCLHGDDNDEDFLPEL